MIKLADEYYIFWFVTIVAAKRIGGRVRVVKNRISLWCLKFEKKKVYQVLINKDFDNNSSGYSLTWVKLAPISS